MQNMLCADPPDHLPAAWRRVAPAPVEGPRSLPLSDTCTRQTSLHKKYQDRIDTQCTFTTHTCTCTTHSHYSLPSPHSHTLHTQPHNKYHSQRQHHTPSAPYRSSQCSNPGPTVSKAEQQSASKHIHITCHCLAPDSTLALRQVESPYSPS